MRLLYYYDDNWVQMKEHFERSFKDVWQVDPINTTAIKPKDQQSDAPEFRKGHVVKGDKSAIGGGMGSWLTKVNMVIDALQDGFSNDIVVVADTDIIFYKPVQPLIHAHMQRVDMCFQKENHGMRNRQVNIGFISLRCTQAVVEFWEQVRDRIISTEEWDQRVVNLLLYEDKNLPRWGWFPPSVYCKTHKGPLPRDMVLHHANATKTMESKFQQFRDIRREWRRQHYKSVQPSKIYNNLTINELQEN